MTPYRILVPSGCLGSSYPAETLTRGVAMRPQVIAVDAGSTDSGPFYLGTATSKMTRKAIREDLRRLMHARAAAGVPLLIGSCGTSGTDAGVDWTAAICAEIAREDGLSATVALVYSEQSAEALRPYLRRNRIQPLPPAEPLTDAALESCDHIVAVLGHEPFAAAVAAGADIVLAGRSTDTGVLAALALQAGLPPAHVWHAAKIAECGALCTDDANAGGVMLTIGHDGFEVEPLHPDNHCTPYSVAAHLLYENADPDRLTEPGVVIDTSAATYTSLNDRVVRVAGARAEFTPYTMKLEGAGRAGYRTLAFTAIADPDVMGRLDEFLGHLQAALRRRIQGTLGYGPDDYAMEFRPYGWHVLDQSSRAPEGPPPREIGLMVLVSAPAQETASEIAKFCNPMLLHFPLHRDGPMPSWALPFSPAEVDMGAYYEFRLNHVVEVDAPAELVRTKFIRVGPEEASHAAA